MSSLPYLSADQKLYIYYTLKWLKTVSSTFPEKKKIKGGSKLYVELFLKNVAKSCTSSC